ncbi:MAG: hypothetical protein JW787_14295 [Sedimentisphaerales bacterium]|nr:hypothetical protein [Sedimentisphaerales bacterium]
MKRIILIICFICLLFAGCKDKSTSGNTEKEWTFHTEPDKWEEPRIFQTPFDDHWADRISIKQIPMKESQSDKVLSSNKAYWFSVIEPNSISSAIRDAQINIYNERDYILCINLLQLNHYQITTNWVNEKIVYIRAWWGRVLGFDLLFDVEKEMFIYKENVNDGGIPYSQWQQVKVEK